MFSQGGEDERMGKYVSGKSKEELSWKYEEKVEVMFVKKGGHRSPQ